MTGDRAPRRILFLGTHGQANVGDELLLETFLDQLGSEHRYDVNSYDPADTARKLAPTHDVDVFDTAGSPVGVLRRIVRADVVVFGGGSIVKELYGSTGRWRYSTLCMVLAIVATARLTRTPVLLSNVGVGPITRRTGRLLAGLVVRLASAVSVRDVGSLETCERLGCRPGSVRLVPDAVWANDAGRLAPSAPLALDPRPGAAPLRIALNVNRDIEDASAWEPFTRSLVEALRLAGAERPIEVHGLPMQCAFKQRTDLDELDRLFEQLDGAPGVRTVRHAPADHREVAAIIEACDVVVTERLHAIVMASVLGRAVVGLPYDVKVRELVDQLGLVERSFDVNRHVDPAALAAAVLDAADHGEREGRRLAALATSRRCQALVYFSDVRTWLERPDRRGWPTTVAG